MFSSYIFLINHACAASYLHSDATTFLTLLSHQCGESTWSILPFPEHSHIPLRSSAFWGQLVSVSLVTVASDDHSFHLCLSLFTMLYPSNLTGHPLSISSDLHYDYSRYTAGSRQKTSYSAFSPSPIGRCTGYHFSFRASGVA